MYSTQKMLCQTMCINNDKFNLDNDVKIFCIPNGVISTQKKRQQEKSLLAGRNFLEMREPSGLSRIHEEKEVITPDA